MHRLFQRVETSKSPEPDTASKVLLSMLSRAENGVVAFAPGIAKRVLDELTFPGQRDIKAMRVAKHKKRIVAGTWRPSFPISFARLPNGELICVNGHHRLTAISQHESAVRVRVLVDDAQSMDEVRRLYVGHDEATSVRTAGEVVSASGVVDRMGLKADTARNLFRALPLLMNGLEPVAGSSAEGWQLNDMDNRLDEIANWATEAKTYEAIISYADTFLRRKMSAQGLMAVALYTLRHQPTRATEFWLGLAKNDGLRARDPRARLIADMLNRALTVGSFRQKVQQPTIAWNAWNEGRELSIIKCIEGAPIIVWGTPMAKGRA